MDISKLIQNFLNENSTISWMKLMKNLEKEFPFLNNSGPPRKDEILNSQIGKLGYKTWKTYIEDGLGWNLHTYKSFKKAWKVCKEHPYLLTSDLTASEINRINTKYKEFPPDLNSLLSLVEMKKKKSNLQISSDMRTQIHRLTDDLYHTNMELEEVKKRNRELEIKNQKLEKEIDILKEKFKRE